MRRQPTLVRGGDDTRHYADALAIAFFGAGIDSVLAIEIARFQSCLTAQGAGCPLDFDMWMAVTPQFIGGLVAVVVAVVLAVAFRRAGMVRR